MVEFYKKVDKNTHNDVFDTSVSTFFSDLAEGKETTLTVRSGRYNDLALFDYPVPDAPSYGDGKLSGFSFQFEMDDTAVSSLNFAGPFDIHMFKKNQELGDEEGSVSRVVDSTNNVFAPAAVLSVYHEDAGNEPENCYLETFKNAGPDTVVHAKGASIVHENFHYLLEADAEEAVSTTGKVSYFLGGTGSISAYSTKHPTTGEDIVHIKQLKEGKWVSAKDTGALGQLAFYEDKSVWNVGIGEEGIAGKIRHFDVDVFNASNDEINKFHEVTTDQCFFDAISTNTNYQKPIDAQSSSSDIYQFQLPDTTFHAYSGINFATDKQRTSGTSMNMVTSIDYNAAINGASQKDFNYGTGRQRQSIFVVKRNIPMPLDFFDDLNGSTASRTTASPTAMQEIDIDVYFDEMAPAYLMEGQYDATDANDAVHHVSNVNEREDLDVFTHLRSFCVIFSEKAPDDNQDFGDFIYSHTNGSGDKNISSISDVTEDLMGVMFYLEPAGATEGQTAHKIRVKTLSGHGTAGAPTLGADGDDVVLDTATNPDVADPDVSKKPTNVLGWTKHSETGSGLYTLSTKKWYRLKFIYSINGKNGIQNDNDGDGAGANMNMFIFDPETNELANSNQSAASTANHYRLPIPIKNCNLNLTDRCNQQAWPSNMSIWLNNTANTYTTSINPDEDIFFSTSLGGATLPKYTRNSVYIDRIAIKNNNLVHANMGGENNPFFASGEGKIISNNKCLVDPVQFTVDTSSPYKIPPTGLALGFNDRTQLNSATKYLLFNGFGTKNSSVTTALSDSNMHAGYLDASIPSTLGDIAYNIASDGSDVLDTITIGANENIKTGDNVNSDPLQDVDGFSQKGLVKITSSAINGNWNADSDLRECLWASSRILEAKHVTSDRARLYVDDVQNLSMPTGTTFRIYKALESLATSTNYCDVYLDVVDGNYIRVSRKSGTALDTLLVNTATNNTLDRMMISPLLYWLLIQTSANGELPERTYKSVCLLDDDLATTGGGVGLGATYNERSFASSSGVTNYTNIRDLNIDSDNPAFDKDVDFGFGTFKDNQTGYAAQFVPKLGTNLIDFGGKIQDVKKFKPRDRFSFLIKPTSIDGKEDYRMIMKSSENSTTTDRPRLYAHFEDEVPVIEDFTVTPNQENPQFMDFKWKTKDSDLWYGLLIVDNEQIGSQYHGAIAHIPFNEEENNVGFLYYPDQGDRYTDGTNASAEVTGSVTATVTSERDGLAGYCKKFDATDSLLTFATSGNLTDPTNEMTLVVHCIPEYVSSSQSRNLFFRSGFLVVTLESSGSGTFVQSVVTNTDGTSYTLKSPYVYTDGETPLAIIVTYDSDLKSKGYKLFLNGLLADSIDIADSNLASNNNSILIGNDDNADNDAFNGRVEEIVLYNQCHEVINPQSKSFTYTRPLKRGETNKETASSTGSIQNYCARLFLKDYHNIRGYSTREVGSSSQLNILRTAFSLSDT